MNDLEIPLYQAKKWAIQTGPTPRVVAEYSVKNVLARCYHVFSELGLLSSPPGRLLVRYVNIRTMKASFSEYINSLDEGGPVLITNHGEPKAMLIPFTHWEQKHLIQLDEKALAEAIVSHTVEMQERIARRLKLRPNWKASDKHLFRD